MAAEIPFRFKSGGAMSEFHHRSTTKSTAKPFKTRHATKSALKERSKGKVNELEKGARRTSHQQVMGKLDRRNHARQLRQNKLGERREESSVFAGRDGAPRIVSVIALCGDVDCEAVRGLMDSSVAAEQGQGGVEVPRFKTRIQYLTPDRTDLFAVLDACQVADYVLFVLSATQEVDELGERILRCVESQGISTTLTGATGLDSVEPAKKRPDVLRSLKSYINFFFAEQEKVHDLSSRQDCSNVMRSICATTPKGIRWREDRSWMHVDELRWEEDRPVMTGTVRGRALKADRLVEVGEWGTFQISKITAAPTEGRSNKRLKTDEMAVEPTSEQILDEPTSDRDDLADLAPEDAAMDDPTSLHPTSMAPSERKHVLLDDHQYFDESDAEELDAPKRVPRGTSKYQAAWYLGDNSDSGSDMEDIDPHDDVSIALDPSMTAADPADGHFPDDMTMGDVTEGAPTEYAKSEFFPDAPPEDEAAAIAAYRQQRRAAAEEDKEFPDEIELHPHVAARERLARYRGLKSLRNSTWETEADRLYQPEEWSRLLEIADYKAARNRVIKEARMGSGGVKPGTRVSVHLSLAPGQTKAALQALRQPTALFALLRHEHKRTGVNVSISLSSEYPAPLKSKEEVVLQCGPWRMVVQPLFSQEGRTPNNVHKFDRYLHPGRTAVASFVGAVTWGSVPALWFKRSVSGASRSAGAEGEVMEDTPTAPTAPETATGFDLIATGTSLPPSTSRVIAKRIVLTGHPYKIHKRLVTVRYMFFSDADVEYFKALQLWTKRGRAGHVKEALGTHGYFKATFDGKVGPLDAVGVSLYKRVWPRGARRFVGGA